jgi:hypothetical protein
MRNEIERVVVGIPQTTLDELVQEVKAVKELCESRFQKNKTGEEWLSSEAKTWQKYRNERRIPFSQFGRKIYVKRSDLEDFINSHCIK